MGLLALVLSVSLARADSAFSTVTLVDGQTLTGLATVLPDGGVSLVIAGGNVLMIPASAVRSVSEAGGPVDRVTPAKPVESVATPVQPVTAPVHPVEPPAPPLPEEPSAGTSPNGWPSDPNRVGYFYAPSAFTLGQGRGYVAQKELAITAAAVGITSFWDVQVGTVLPLLFTETRVGIAGTKVALRLAPGLRVGAGVQAFFVASEVGAAPFVVVTLGNEDRHISLDLGLARFLTQAGGGSIVLATLSGDYRLGPRTALVTENWVFVGDLFPAGLFVVPTAGVRLFGPAFAVDLGGGVLSVDGTVVPLPWVGFTWNWGVAGKPIPAAD
jgi:hypothetical protein